jgi:predicted TIM-barrel fold metal-dependent hydrolase
MDETRRTILAGMGGAAAAIVLRPSVASAQQVPFSSGSERPKLVAPPNATDCHHHIYDHKYPVDPRSTLRPPDATVDDYRKLQQRLGITRHVIIQPSTYGTDNRDVIESIAAFGPTARGIAVVENSISDRELKDMDAKGVRGLRFNLGQPGAPSISMLESLSGRINDLGWHVQVNVLGRDLPGIMDILRRLPSPIVFDHLGRLPEPGGTTDPAYGLILELVHKGRAWVKLTGAYLDSKIGPPTYSDTSAVGSAFVREAPERCLWGTDWPHPSEKGEKPDDAVLFDLLALWAPDAKVREQILVRNPEQLYRFEKTS